MDGSFTKMVPVLGDHDAPVPEEEVRWDQDKHLPLCHLVVPLHFHQDLSESSRLRECNQKNIQNVFLSSYRPSSLCVSPGGHVFRSCVYPAGFGLEHLCGCHRPVADNSFVHCYRCVCVHLCILCIYVLNLHET